MTVTNGIKVELLVDPSELGFILKLLGAFKNDKILDILVSKENDEKRSIYDRVAFDGPPLSPKQFEEILAEAESGESIDYHEFKKAHGL